MKSDMETDIKAATPGSEIFGMACILFGAVLWSALAVAVKEITMDPVLFCACRALIAGLALLPTVFFCKSKVKITKSLVIMSITYCLLNMLLVFSLKNTSTSIAIGMQFTSPLWIFLLSYFMGKRLTFKEKIPLILILVGVLIFMLAPSKTATPFGNFLAFMAGIAFAVLTSVSGKAGGDNPFGATAIANLAASAIMFIIAIPHWGDLQFLSNETWLWVIFIGVFQTAGGFSLFNLGLKHTPAHKASILSTAELVCSVILVAIIFHEVPDIFNLLGIVFIMSGIVVQVVLEGRKYRQSKQAGLLAATTSGVAISKKLVKN